MTLKSTSDWVKVKNLIKLWDSLKKKEITVIIKVNWGQKAIKDCITEKKVFKKEEKKKKNKFKC